MTVLAALYKVTNLIVAMMAVDKWVTIVSTIVKEETVEEKKEKTHSCRLMCK